MNEEELFHQALARSPEERAAFLEQACGGDAALRAALEALLRANVGATGFLAQPAPAPVALVDEQPLSEGPGTVIGPYKLLQQIGEGGMGTVYMAEQSRPVQRKVALKIIKPGMDRRQVLARFEQERQALALMDHPHIARVLDAGTTESGRPYFVMELVKGVPITKYCDQHRLTPKQRLELFVPVCQAVQHAHQKGIIHRDIKPSNVMICTYDGKPVPKVIDFGVAKATGPKLTERTLFTELGQVVGTLEYMSPEQAELNQLDVDTRSDIYSLGVLLYELLTGTTPLERRRVKDAAFLEVLRLIREEEAPRPSTRLSTTAELPSIAANRNLEPKRLRGLVRGELDWIVMKALEKDRDRRYETASAFAADVERYLKDEAVHACPPSASYRFRKFARRYKGLLTTVGVVVLALVTGTVVSAWQALRATEAEELAQTRLQAATEAWNATRDQLHLTQQAEGKATHRLYGSLVAQARASRLSRRMGQRFKTLEVLAEAAGMAREMNLPPADFLELRNEAIACLAVADLRVEREWPGWRSDDLEVDFDGTLEHYACTNRQGVCSIRRSADGTEILSLTDMGAGGSGNRRGDPRFSRDGSHVAVWYNPGALKMWMLGGPNPVLLVDEPAKVTAFAFSPCSRLSAFGLSDGAMQVVDLISQRRLPRFKVGPVPAYLAFHPSRRQFAVVSNRTTIQICDVDSGKILDQWLQPAGANSMCWHPDGHMLAAASGRVVYLWDTAKHKQVVQLQGHQDFIVQIAFNHAGNLIASCSWDNTLRLWDPRTGQQLFHTQAVARALRFSPDDQYLAAGIDGNNLRIWQVAPAYYRTLVRDPALGRGVYQWCASCPNSRRLAARMTDGVSLWDVSSGNPLAFLPLTSTGGVLFEPSGALLTNASAGVLRWPIGEDSTGKSIGRISNPSLLTIGPPQKLPLPGSMHQIASSRDGRVLASAQGWGGLVWNQDRSEPPIRLAPHEDTRAISISPDARWVATGSYWGTKVKIWEAGTGKLAHELPVETGSPVRFSPDGRWLATIGGGCRLWAVPSWQEGPRLSDRGMPAFSPDGKVLAVDTGYAVVRLLHPDTGREYARLEDPNHDRAAELVFSADGSQLVATNGDSHSIHVWELRKIRQQLAKMGLDWSLPPYPAAPEPKNEPPPRVTVDAGSLSLTRAQQATQAIDQARRAVQVEPDGAEACNNLAWAYLTGPEALRDVKAALPLAEKAVRLEPAIANWRNTLGVAYYRAGRYREAVDILRPNLASQADSGLAFDLYFLAMSHQRLGQTAPARAYFDWAARWSRAHQDLSAAQAEELTLFQAEAEELFGINKK